MLPFTFLCYVPKSFMELGLCHSLVRSILYAAICRFASLSSPQCFSKYLQIDRASYGIVGSDYADSNYGN
ncbi:hypothetical protein BH10BAC2_BH10BAC2_23060 [soil metagenome]